MFVYIIRFVDTIMYSNVACDVMKERTLYLLKPSSLIWHLMPYLFLFFLSFSVNMGAQWLNGRVLHSRSRGCRLESHQGHCIVFLSKAH